jgi:hypothetical protein
MESRAQQAKDWLLLGNDWTSSGLVFTTEAGRPPPLQDVRKQFAQLCERAGLGTWWHPNETRHTGVSVLSEPTRTSRTSPMPPTTSPTR